MPPWIDAHNHLHDPRLGPPQPMVEAMKRAGIARCVANAVCEADWPVLSTLAGTDPDFLRPAFGIHPWKAGEVSDGWQDRLLVSLEKNPQASVGECGLDRWISHPPIRVQIPVFHAQLRLARELDRPITIHCLKAWGLLMDAFEREPPPSAFLLHSYSGSPETARQLVALGAYFSFSGYILHERKRAEVEVFRSLPLDRILLETDAPDMTPPDSIISHPLPGSRNHPANLPSIGSALADALEIPPDELSRITSENACRCFGF